jgi:hypothetical protein
MVKIGILVVWVFIIPAFLLWHRKDTKTSTLVTWKAGSSHNDDSWHFPQNKKLWASLLVLWVIGYCILALVWPKL